MEYGGCLKSCVKKGSRLGLQIILFAIFLLLFGMPALEKYNRKEVMVVNTVKNTNGIPIPAITIEVLDLSGYDSCLYRNDTSIARCFDGNAKNWTQIMRNGLIGLKRREVINMTEDVMQEDFTHAWSGRSVTLELSFRIGPNDNNDQVFILLDPNIGKYQIFIHDPEFFVYNINPTAGFIFMKYRNSGYYYPLELTEMNEIDNPSDPCNSDADYNFRECVKQSVTLQVSQNPFCRSYSEYSHSPMLLLCKFCRWDVRPNGTQKVKKMFYHAEQRTNTGF